MTGDTERTSILAVHPGALGDVIFFGHLLSALGGRVTLLTGGEKGRLLKAAGVAAKAMDIDALPIHEAFADTPLEQCRLPKLLGRHDRLISCLGGGNRRAETRLAAMCQTDDAVFLPVRPPHDYPRHLLDLWTDLLGVPAIPPDPCPWKLDPKALAGARQSLAGIAPKVLRPSLVIHPGAGSPAKCWPLEKFLQLAKAFSSRSGFGSRSGGVVFVLGPVERERWPAGTVGEIARRYAVLDCPSLIDLAVVVQAATVVVGNDSGVTHLAAAMGTPTVALFGPTRPEHFAPRGHIVHIVSATDWADVSVARVLGVLEYLPRRQTRRSPEGVSK